MAEEHTCEDEAPNSNRPRFQFTLARLIGAVALLCWSYWAIPASRILPADVIPIVVALSIWGAAIGTLVRGVTGAVEGFTIGVVITLPIIQLGLFIWMLYLGFTDRFPTQ